MIDLITDEWREALRLVKLAANAETGTPEREAARAAAFAHLLQPGATDRSIQAALVPLERVDNRSRITDAEMGIRTTDSPRAPDRADFVVVADNIRSVPTCRNNDVPYEKGYTYTVTVDGFVVSDNVKATAQNIDAGFEYSDHNPVLLTFELQ